MDGCIFVPRLQAVRLCAESDVVVITYEELNKLKETPDGGVWKVADIIRFGGICWWRVVLDEAQTVQNAKSAACRAIDKMERVHTWCTTGTPIGNGERGEGPFPLVSLPSLRF